MHPLQHYTQLSKYARWLDEENRRERWDETVDRYLNHMTAHLKRKHDYTPSPELLTEIREYMLGLKLFPSMRAVMTAGPALERSEIAGYNPVSGSTRVLTRDKGLREIRELYGDKTEVLNVEGRWAEATFNYFGKQDTYRVTFGGRRKAKPVNATANHRWILEDGSVVPTSELKPGDRIPYSSAPRPDTENIDYKLGIVHGLIYGDGTTTYSQERVSGYMIRLCRDQEDLLPYFEGYGSVCHPPSANGDPVITLRGSFAKTHSLKTLPSGEETEEYLLGFIRGWLAADGSVGTDSHVSICVTDDGLNWLHQYAPRVGILCQGFNELPAKTNFGDRKRRTYIQRLDRRSMVPEDFIIRRKRDRFRPYPQSTYCFNVASVEATGVSEDVYCAEVPDTNTFVLEDGVVTGNCAFVTVDNQRAFSEILYILMNGTGVGFSVEKQYVSKLPYIPTKGMGGRTRLIVTDSKEGWAYAFQDLLDNLWMGNRVTWDLSWIRPKGARLKVFGGRASGPEPLDELFRFTVETFDKARGRKLTPIEVHDIVCKVAKVIVSGGVRRSALIGLSDLDDRDMAEAKSGEWWVDNDQRALANNSAVYRTGISREQFLEEWRTLAESGSGERGIFNIDAARSQAARYGRDPELIAGCNPCSEILLRDKQFCNLSTVVVQPDESLASLKRRIELAAVLGTWQSTLTDFPYLSKRWKFNTEDERLLGVSMTNILSNPMMTLKNPDLPEYLTVLRESARLANEAEAARIGIPASKAVTCVKPEGTTSSLSLASSGLHPWHSQYYIRTVRETADSPIARLLVDYGVPHEVDAMNDRNLVFSLPVKAPEGAVTRKDLTAIQHLELWLEYQRHYCEHKPSVTISVRDHEWDEVGEWVWEHLDECSGVSFLPYSDHSYAQAPYQECTREEYEAAAAAFPEVRWEDLSFYEQQDSTTGSQEYACVAGHCEL